MSRRGAAIKRRSPQFRVPGVKGRTTGRSAKKNVARGAANLEDVDDFFDSDGESMMNETQDFGDFSEAPTPAGGSSNVSTVRRSSRVKPAVPSKLKSSTPAQSTPVKTLFTPQATSHSVAKPSPLGLSTVKKSSRKSPRRSVVSFTVPEFDVPSPDMPMEQPDQDHDDDDDNDDNDNMPVDDNDNGPVDDNNDNDDANDVSQYVAGNKAPTQDKVTTKAATKKPKAAGKRRKAEVNVRNILAHNDNGRPKRQRFKPTRYWKGERLIYEQEEVEGQRLGVMTVKDVLLVETPAPTKPKRKRKKRLTPKEKAAATSSTPVVTPSRSSARIVNPIDERVLESDTLRVNDWTNGHKADGAYEAVDMPAVKTYNMQSWTTSSRTNLKFCKCFSMSDARWASGLMELAEGITKPNSHTTTNFLLFTVVKGVVKFNLNDQEVTVGAGATFFVPPYNQYSVGNPGEEAALLSYVQIKEPQLAGLE